MDQTIFKEEQQHLTQVYQRLLAIRADLEKKIEQLNSSASDEKNDIRDNLRFDFADTETTMETYGEIEVWNRYIDKYNVESEALTDKLRRVDLLLKAPYFARVRLQFDPDEEPEDYYIGNAAISENGYDQMIIDWRSPIAETYYNQENGHTSYEVEGKRIPVDLLLRRQFDLEKDQLHYYFDSQIAIEDPLLLQSLSRQKSDKMTAITVTIQKEQNAVIRHPDVPVLLVNGIAGSGKTSVLLQRIAYLFYRKRKTLRPDQVYLITLNPVFRRYIDNVLPDLGESNPNTMTWDEFLDGEGIPQRSGDYRDTKAENLEKIDAVLPTLRPRKEDFLGISQKGTQILSAGDVLQVVQQYPNIPMGVRLIQVVMDELEERAKAVIRKREDNAARSGALSDEDSAKALQDTDTAQENRMTNDNGGAFKAIHDCSWVNISEIGKRILGDARISDGEWFYLKMALTGECDRNAQYVMIDEVQDYTKAQLMVFMRYFPNAKFMLLGDEFQAVRESTVSFAQIHALFDAAGRKVTELPLMTSYRSSPEITALFTALLPAERRGETRSVQRPGLAPVIQTFTEDERYADALRSAVQDTGKEGITAVICANKKSLARIKKLLGEDCPTVVHTDERLPKRGVIAMELTLAKGLEFDRVVIPDADDQHYPDQLLSAHRLYTAMSRATQELTVLARGTMTPLITGKDRG